MSRSKGTGNRREEMPQNANSIADREVVGEAIEEGTTKGVERYACSTKKAHVIASSSNVVGSTIGIESSCSCFLRIV